MRLPTDHVQSVLLFARPINIVKLVPLVDILICGGHGSHWLPHFGQWIPWGHLCPSRQRALAYRRCEQQKCCFNPESVTRCSWKTDRLLVSSDPLSLHPTRHVSLACCSEPDNLLKPRRSFANPKRHWRASGMRPCNLFNCIFQSRYEDGALWPIIGATLGRCKQPSPMLRLPELPPPPPLSLSLSISPFYFFFALSLYLYVYLYLYLSLSLFFFSISFFPFFFLSLFLSLSIC